MLKRGARPDMEWSGRVGFLVPKLRRQSGSGPAPQADAEPLARLALLSSTAAWRVNCPET